MTLPVSIGTVTDYAPYLLSGYAVLEALTAFLVVLGMRSLSMLLILMTILQKYVMHNPYYRNTTEIDRQRCYKNIINELFMVATLIIITDIKKVKDKQKT
jgi:uncharacterized membrane protein YidH (DUF202 family)